MMRIYSDSWGTEIAQLFKNLESDNKMGAITGRVVNTNPLVISIMSGEVLINSKIQNIYTTDELNKKTLMVEDRVLLIPNESEKVFYVIDKIRKE